MVLKADLNVTLRTMVPVGNEVEEDRLETFADRPEKHSVIVSRLLRPWGCLSVEELKAMELLEPGRVPFAEGEFEQVGDAEALMLSTVLIVILILILLGALPTWGYSSGWGYGPGGIVGTILVIVVILALLGRI